MNYKEFKRNLGRAGLTNKTIPNHYAVIALLMIELADNGIEFQEKVLNLKLKEAKPRGKGFISIKEKFND